MCTVTFFPKGNNEYILTSNRDVAPNRHANEIFSQKINGYKITYPLDPKARGTWIAVGAEGRVTCLLNGGFVGHKPNPPYQKSRGLIVLESFQWDSFESFAKEYDFKNIEPFTLIGLNPLEGFFEFRWTGQLRYLRKLSNNTPTIWSSATLYNRPVRSIRATWFNRWLQQNETFTTETIRNFHLNGGEIDLINGFVMNRSGLVCTTSLSQVELKDGIINLYHTDLITKSSTTVQL